MATLWLVSSGYHLKAKDTAQALYTYLKEGGPADPAVDFGPLGPSAASMLKAMYRGDPQRGTDGQLHKPEVGDGVQPWEGMFVYDLCRRIKAKNTLEVGLASGFSTVFFLAAATANGGVHTALDPFQTKGYKGVGVQRAKDLGMDGRFRFYEEYSSHAIPQFAREGKKYDVIFIDGNHRFDDVFVDFTLADQICANGGYILLHDYWMPSVKKVVAFIEKNRSDYVSEPRTAPNVVVLRKVGEDTRKWTHYIPF